MRIAIYGSGGAGGYVPLQNGVEAASQLAAELGPAPVLTGLCGTFSWVVAPGCIRSLGNTNFVRFGEVDNRRSERAERLRRAFERAGLEAEVPADIHKAMWIKFAIVAATGGIGSLSRAAIGVMRSLPETRSLLERCMAEVYAVGRARGVAVGDNALAEALATIDTLAAGATTSLQRDLADGKSSLEGWNGAVVRLGREAALATPFNEFIYASLLPLERRARGSLAFPA